MFHCMAHFPLLDISCSITFLYDCPQLHKQKDIWETLLTTKIFIISLWAIIGDFNEIIHPREKIGGTTSNSTRMQNFAYLV